MLYENKSTIGQDPCYLTLNVADWADIFVKPVFKQIIAESLNYFISRKNLVVYGWCLMTNHLHLLAGVKNNSSLLLVADELKEFTSKIILDDLDAESEVRRNWMMKKFKEAGRQLRFHDKFQVWQKSFNPVYFDRPNIEVICDCLNLIHNHPVRDRIVTRAADYLYSSARDYMGIKGLVSVTMVEEISEMHSNLRYMFSY